VKWINPFKLLPVIFHSPWFKPWAMKRKQTAITVSTVLKL